MGAVDDDAIGVALGWVLDVEGRGGGGAGAVELDGLADICSVDVDGFA